MSNDYEAHTPTPPYMNTTAMRCIGNFAVSNAGNRIGLATYFAGLGDGHFLSIQADGAKIYVAFASNEIGTLDAFATGAGATVCWPIPDGVTMPVVPKSGKEVGVTGAYAPTFAVYETLHAKVASGGVATAYLRLYRSSLAPGQAPGAFLPKAP
jgi:hypothetical protein